MNHPQADRWGFVPYHRWLIENKIGRFLNEQEVVGHKNRDRLDNNLDNLVLRNKGDFRGNPRKKIEPPTEEEITKFKDNSKIKSHSVNRDRVCYEYKFKGQRFRLTSPQVSP